MKLNIFFIILLIILFLPVSVSAIKIQFGNFDNKIFFEPNLKQELVFTISEAQRSAKVPITLEGNMAKYATVKPDLLELNPGEIKEITVKLDFPAEIPEGIHHINLVAKEIPRDTPDGAFILIPGVGASLKIINTEVGQDCNLNVFNAMMNNNAARVVFNLVNNGIKEINGVYADLELYDPDNKLINSWSTEKNSILAVDSKTIETSIPLNDAEPEYYTVKGTIFCGENKFYVDEEIMNHAQDLKIHDFRAYKTEDALRMEFELENEFLVPIVTYGMVWFYEGDKHVAHYALPKKKIMPKSKEILGISKKFQGLRVPAGTYALKGELKFEGNTKFDNTVITLTEKDLEKKTDDSQGFAALDQETKKKEESTANLEQPSGIAVSGKTIIRIIAAAIIIAVLFLLLFKNIYKRE